MPDTNLFDDILAEGAQPAAGVFDDLLAAEKPAAGAFDDILAEEAPPPAPAIAGTEPAKRDPEAEVAALKADPGMSTMAGLAPETAADMPQGGSASDLRFGQEFGPSIVPRPNERPDTWVESAIRHIENLPAWIRQQGGALLESVARSAAEPPEGIESLPLAFARLVGRKDSQPGPDEAAARERLASMGREVSKAAAEEIRANAPNVDPESWTGYSSKLTDGFLKMAPMIAIAMATKSPALALSEMGVQVYGETYAQARDKGRTDQQAKGDAIFSTVAETIPEVMPLGFIMKSGGKFLPRVFAAGHLEGISETMTETLQIGYDAGILKEDMTWGQARDRIAEAWGQGVGMGKGMAAVTHPFERGTGQPAPPPPPSQEALDAQAEAIRLLSPGDRASPLAQTPHGLDSLAKGREILAQAEAAAAGTGGPRLMTAPPPVAGQSEPISSLGSDVRQETVDVNGAPDVVPNLPGEATGAPGPLLPPMPSGAPAGVAEGASEDGGAEGRPSGVQPGVSAPQAPAQDVGGGPAPEPAGAQPAGSPSQGGAVDLNVNAPVGDGTRAAPVKVEAGEHLEVGNENVNADPSPEQAAAGNYQKKHLRWEGFAISIENPKGSIRRNKNPDGPKWEVEMPSDYGDIKGTKGADGDNIDISMGPNPNAPTVFVIDQRDEKTGKFDEHKVKAGFDTEEQALNDYFDGFSDGGGPARLGAITPMSRPDFKVWAKDEERTTRALAYKDEDPRDAPGFPKRGVSADGDGRWKVTNSAGMVLRGEGGRPFASQEQAQAFLDRTDPMVKAPAGEPGPSLQTPTGQYPKQDELKAKIAAKNEAPKLVVARKMPDGSVRYGKPGDLHPSLMGGTESAADRSHALDNMGFAEPGGPYMTRAEALAFIQKNEPDRAARLSEDGKKGRVEAADYQGGTDAILDLRDKNKGKAAAPDRPAPASNESAPSSNNESTKPQPSAAERIKAKDRAEFRAKLNEHNTVHYEPTGTVYQVRKNLPDDSWNFGRLKDDGGIEIVRGPRGQNTGWSRPQAIQAAFEDAFADAREEPEAAPTKGWTEIGKNADGETVYQDERGARSVVSNGVRQTESIRMVPTREGTKVGIPSDSERDKRYMPVPTGTEAKPEPAKPAADAVKPSEQAPTTENIPAGAKAGNDERTMDRAAPSAPSVWTPAERDRAEELRIRIRNKLRNQTNAGIDPELLALGAELAVLHIKAGARKFAQFAKAMAADLEQSIADLKPYLRSWYMGAQLMMEDSGLDVSGMDDAEAVKSALAALMVEQDAPKTEEKPAPEKKPEPARDYGTAEKPNVFTLGQAVADHFNGGGRFENIIQARAFIGERLGTKIDSKSVIAKQADEALEVGVVLAAQQIARTAGRNTRQRYDALVDLYARQPKLDTRTSTSVEQQAYSTPAPLAFLASRLAGITRLNTIVYEPTAGNGMLLIEARAYSIIANELNDARRTSLKQVLGAGATVTGRDAAESSPGEKVDVVIANPPFGKVKENGVTRLFPLDGRMTKEIDLGISWRALKSMKDDGRAVLIIGSKRGTQEERAVEYRSFETMSFMKKLYDAYNVVDHFSVDGKLYDRQGAGWPVDVIVIEGRGASKFPAPYARVPDMLGSWEEVGRKLDDRVDATGSAAGDGPRPAPASTGAQAADPGLVQGGAGSQNQPAGGTGGPGGRPRPAPASSGQGGSSGGGSVASGGSAGGSVARPEEGGGVPAGAGPAADQGRPGGRGDAEGGDAGGVPVEPVLRTTRVERNNLEAESALSVQYTPKSNSGFAVGTLVPRAMQAAMTRALDALEGRVGDIDQFVADKLGMTLFEVIGSNEKEGYFSAEQVDALALAIDNVEKGGAFIIGDQTGVGKGRFVAAMLKYGLQSGKVPVFFTKDPGLYADMIRDLRDIGMGDIDKRILVTNNDLREGKSVPLSAEDDTDRLSSLPPSEHAIALAEIIASGRLPDGYEMMFTTYSQVQYGPKGKEYDRQRALMALAPNAMVVLDESHEAGGQEAGRKKVNKETGQEIRGRADFVRDLLRDAQGAVYSSATYAKNPTVMSLYFRTDLSMAVDKIEDLAGVIKSGGVPLQQIVANMLVEGGQYARRERSFEGVKMDMDILPTDIKTATEAAATLRAIFRLDADHMEDVRKGFIEEMAGQGVKGGADGAVGQGSASQTGFASIMHNVVSQMLLALNAPAVVDKAIALHKAGKKPIIALANTNEAIIDDFVEQEGLKPGDEVTPTFNIILDRYLKRLRRITLKDHNDKKTHVHLTDDDIRRLGGPGALKAFKAAEALVADANLSSMPANPIDYIMDRLNAAGVKVDEITGRGMVVKDGILGARRGSPAEKVRMRNAFNTGGLDALVINRSGSTGLSLHALLKGGNDGKQRHMIILQPDPNIDVFMQMLGRIHRTGQIRLPEYTIAASDLAIARRPAAVLMRKLASLSANTTASKKSAVSIDTVVDFFNKYGDEVVAEYMLDHPEIAELVAIKGFSADNVDGLAAKFTGRLAIIEPSEVGKIYDDIEAAYTEHVEALDRMGLNTLEAKTLELGARTLETATLVEEKDSSSPFGAAATVETVDAKKMGKAYTVEEAQEAVRKILDGKTPRAFAEGQADALQALGPPFLERLDARIEKARTKFEELAADPEASAKQKEAAADNVTRWMEAKDEAQAKIDRIAEAATTYRPGAAITLLAQEGEAINAVPAIAMGINIKGIRDNPTAMSAVKVKFAVADGSREVTVPLSKLLGAKPQFSTEASDSATVIEAFRSGIKEARERRQIITGNLVAGFAQFKKGQFVMFTNAEGEVRQGILMPREFNANAEMARKPARFDNPAHVVEFLMSGKNTRRVQTEDGIVGISFGASGFDIAVMNKGGKPYYLNQPARAAVGDFQARRGNKVWNPINRPGERAVIALVKAWQENLDAKFITTLDKDEARKITGEKTGLDSQPVDPDDDGGGSGGGSKFQRPYYSALADAIPRLPPKGTGAQMLKTLENMQGVKGAEIAAVGLDDWLKGQERVTREQVAEYVAQNAVEIKEVHKGTRGRRPTEAERMAAVEWLADEGLDDPDNMDLAVKASEGNREAVAALEQSGMPDDLLEPFRAHVGGEGGPKFNRPDTTLPGGENYREILLTLPFNWRKAGWRVVEVSTNRWQIVGPGVTSIPRDAKKFESREEAERVIANSRGDDEFRDGHFPETPNTATHIRVNDRIDSDGKRVLFVEEFQDDWAQKARKLRDNEIKRIAKERGIRKPGDNASAEDRAAWEAVAKEVPADFGYQKSVDIEPDDIVSGRVVPGHFDGWFSPEITTRDGKKTKIRQWSTPEKAEADLAKIRKEGMHFKTGGQPNRPWKSSSEWGALAMRRILKLAVDEGYDRVAWTPGEQQNERYKLSKKVNKIEVTPRTDMRTGERTRSVLVLLADNQSLSFGVGADGTLDNAQGAGARDLEGRDLADVLGKDMADKIMAETGKASYSGNGLDIGGSGMIGFYDKMLVNYANAFGKKYGAKVGTTRIETERAEPDRPGALRGDIPRAGKPAKTETVHAIDVTDPMREALADKGVALFQQGGGAQVDRGPTASWQVAPDLKAEYLLKPEYVARRAEIADVLFELLKKLTTSKRAVLNLADLLTGTDSDGGKTPVSGAYSERANQQGIIESIVSLALIDPKTGEIQNMRALMKTLNHEVLHFLWERNLLTAEEKQILTDAAEAGNWIGRHKIKEGYADLDHAGQIIEAIAEERGDYALGKRRVGKSAAGIFDRIGEMFERLKNWLTGHGFRSFEDIMRASDRIMDKIGSGEIGRREEPSAEALAAETKYSRPPRPEGANDKRAPLDDPDSEARVQKAYPGIGGGDNMVSRVLDWGTAIAQGFDRHWIDLPNTPRFSDVAQQLLKLQAAPHRSKDKIVALLKSVVAGMTKEDLEIFSWKIVLDDLTYEVEQEHLIPFGLTPDTVVSELAKVDAILARRPDLADAVERRKVIVQGIKNDLVEAGILSAESAQNPAYYRHQVLVYAMATKRYAKGVGKSVRTPLWAKREGSQHDINLNYLEAEFDHLHKSFIGLETVRLIDWIKESGHNVRAEVLDRARAANAERIEERLEAERDRMPPRGGPLNHQWRGFRQRIAMGLDHLRRVLEDEEISVPPQYRDAADDIIMQRENDDGQLFNFINWILTNGQPGGMGASTIFKAITERREWSKALLGKKFADTMNPGNLVAEFAPEGYVAWQPDDPDAKGKAMRLFAAKTVPEHAIDAFVRKLIGNTPLTGEYAATTKAGFEAQVREVLAVGGPRYQMIIPQELADTLSNFNSPFDESVVASVLEVPTRWWKVWTLFNPRRAPKYIINNWSGDLDAVIAGNPGVLKKAGQARREIWDVLVKGKEPTNPRYAEALDRNVFQTGLTLQEIPDINSLSEFEALMNPVNWKSPASITKLALKKGWGFVRTTAVLRESIYRYAAYLDYIERIERGDPMDKIPYGASSRPMVEVVEDPKDRAALLARDLLGDYANTSVVGQQLARFAVPFWRFQEINIKRYYRLTSNAFGQGVGKGLGMSAHVAGTIGVKTAAFGAGRTLWLLTRMGALYASIMIWNALMFPDDDDEMDPEERARLHINLGRWNGERVSWRISGASSDAFSWMGFGDALRTMQEVENGRASVGDILAAIAKAPFVKAMNSVSPFIKAPVELAGGIKFFPDVTKPVPIRDRWRYAFDTFTLGHEYDALFDKPSRGYGQSWKESIVSARDSGAAAYGRVQGIAHKWLEREKGVEGFTTISTEKSRLLREWKQAQKFGDQDMADRRYDELIDLGETPKSLKDAAKNAHPLNSIAVKDRPAFMESLTADEERAVDMAVDWYTEVFQPKP